MSVANEDPISLSMNQNDIMQLENKLATNAVVDLSMTQKHKSQKSERIGVKTVDRMGSEMMTEQTLIDHSQMLDESGNLGAPFGTSRAHQIVKNEFAIKEERDDGGESANSNSFKNFNQNGKEMETPSKSKEQLIELNVNESTQNVLKDAQDLPASATEIDPNPSKVISAFQTIPEKDEKDDHEEGKSDDDDDDGDDEQQLQQQDSIDDDDVQGLSDEDDDGDDDDDDGQEDFEKYAQSDS